MGGKNNDGTSHVAESIASELYQQTKPLRTNIINTGGNFLAGGFDPATMPWYEP